MEAKTAIPVSVPVVAVETKKSNKKGAAVAGTIVAIPESSANSDELVDTSLFIENVDGSTSHFALKLIHNLIDENLLETWISCNRPCFALVNVCKVPSARKAAIDAIKVYKHELEKSALSHSGGKLLLEEINK